MTTELRLSLANRTVPAGMKSILFLSVLQPEVLQAALRSHRAAFAEIFAPTVPLNLRASSSKQQIERAVAYAIAADAGIAAGQTQFSARGYVSELALFRQFIGRMTRIDDASSDIIKIILQRFDLAVPNIVPLRDTFAHYDERAIGLAREKKIEIAPDDPDFELQFGWRIQNGRIAARAASGEVVEVEISEGPIQACIETLLDVLELFEWVGPAPRPAPRPPVT